MTFPNEIYCRRILVVQTVGGSISIPIPPDASAARDEHIRKAIEVDAKFVVFTDAHDCDRWTIRVDRICGWYFFWAREPETQTDAEKMIEVLKDVTKPEGDEWKGTE